ncbi:MAG: sugar phosphate isomerase/epimerase [Acidobacteria bacterium]|nr:sugar phosphate isomerase/epimerase [Acidobacteriota bacterium]
MARMAMVSRREMVQGLAAMAAYGAASAKGIAAPAGGHPGIRFGVQLNAFPINPEKFETFLDTLAEVKRIGYQGFESSFRNVMPQFGSPAMARRKIEASGLTFVGVHIFLPNEKYDPVTKFAPKELYQKVARGGASLGAKYLIVSGLPVANERELKQKIDGLNEAGRFAKSAGIRLAYHNHWPEFQSKVGPKGEIEALYTETDPSVVSFVLDAGHAYRGGADVPAFIRKHSKRIVAFHFRDYRNGRLVSLGQGTFPIRQVAETIKQIGWKGWVENEEEREDLSKTGAQVIEPAYKALKEAFSR